jgi:hypothetical protein
MFPSKKSHPNQPINVAYQIEPIEIPYQDQPIKYGIVGYDYRYEYTQANSHDNFIS